ncbi:peptidase C39-like protein [Krasilnikovia cinnamomea]|uniref:Peptidase C39-like protein n=1 Tax=Krasilnikovia cinnamomea TaxID=349313 RepID=A0A4Q7ZT92_9ACTN|nr:C39 family peptidase [Krasilnikovia cinnamomea]RZU53735.1 peptidase C39-like protein [Krasilnikovia cinnamomea]
MRGDRPNGAHVAVADVSTSIAGAARAAAARPKASTAARVEFHAWTTAGDFAAGTGDGVAPGQPLGIVVARPAGVTRYHDPYLDTDQDYEYGTWTSPLRRLGFGATQVLPSWNARTPAGTWLTVELQATMEDGARTGWLALGPWASGDGDIRRHSVSPSAAPYGCVDTDTFTATTGHHVHAYRLRATLYRASGTPTSPRLWQLAAAVSAVPDRAEVPASTPGPASRSGTELPVPAYSQMVHAGEYPQWNGGGRAWCSPASTEMVMEFWGAHPGPDQLARVHPAYADPSVAVAAGGTYDHAYGGTGNWPFNTAYASAHGLNARVVRLRSLDDLERLVADGIPVARRRRSTRARSPAPTTASGAICGSSSGSPVPATWSSTTRRRRPTPRCGTSSPAARSRTCGCAPAGPAPTARPGAARAASRTSSRRPAGGCRRSPTRPTPPGRPGCEATSRRTRRAPLARTANDE